AMADNQAPATSEKPPQRAMDLEIKDAQLIFNSVWNELVEQFGEDQLAFPREIFWLNGAPGAGKGTQTRYIMEYCGLTARPIVVSDLLDSPEAHRLKDAGLMVGDREVTFLLMKKLLDPINATGVVVDGFPRTKVQVECLKLFYQKLAFLRSKYLGTPYETRFHKPIFHIVVLYVDEAVSVNRQMQRGRMVQEHNRQVESTGTGQLKEVRKTDLTVEAARGRYRTFKEITYESLTSLREIFHYHFINAQQTIEEVQQSIVEELRYQTSLELDQRTNDIISRIPVASDIVLHARQQLVERLEKYTLHNCGLIERVVSVIEEKFMPIVLRHAISGRAYINSEDAIFDDPLALAMFIDVFSERGYQASVDIRQDEMPDRIDLQTGKIHTRRKRVYRFRIHFQGSVIRRGH
ncbi:MAG TPA: nucleoside monophosphate kinase, partial [Oceanipulchritudo sp.]|nr:nucleoside monophosphate kinase [Oceanipulchritudo sp.]